MTIWMRWGTIAAVATDDTRIFDAVAAFGGRAVMTSALHRSGTDRIAEACGILVHRGSPVDIALNVQGDEPLLKPETLDLLIDPYFREEGVACVNLIENLEGEAEINSYNNVKCIFDQRGFALYFSRLPIPYGLQNRHYKQLGLYSFTRETILRYPAMAMTPLEIAESDDMLRFVENGIGVKVALSPYKTVGVDTPAEHEEVSRIMETDPLFQQYRNL